MHSRDAVLLADLICILQERPLLSSGIGMAWQEVPGSVKGKEVILLTYIDIPSIYQVGRYFQAQTAARPSLHSVSSHLHYMYRAACLALRPDPTMEAFSLIALSVLVATALAAPMTSESSPRKPSTRRSACSPRLDLSLGHSPREALRRQGRLLHAPHGVHLLLGLLQRHGQVRLARADDGRRVRGCGWVGWAGRGGQGRR